MLLHENELLYFIYTAKASSFYSSTNALLCLLKLTFNVNVKTYRLVFFKNGIRSC